MTVDTAARRWRRVKWTEAGQVAALLDDVVLDEADARATPADWWERRVDAGDLTLAVRFLAMALPRIEAIAWAAEMLERAGTVDTAERAALSAVAHWIQVTDDPERREAWAAASDIEEGPARFLGAAVFFSGGSIAPADCYAVPPPPTACGVAVGATVLAAAARAPDRDGFLAEALHAGAALAAQDAG